MKSRTPVGSPPRNANVDESGSAKPDHVPAAADDQPEQVDLGRVGVGQLVDVDVPAAAPARRRAGSARRPAAPPPPGPARPGRRRRCRGCSRHAGRAPRTYSGRKPAAATQSGRPSAGRARPACAARCRARPRAAAGRAARRRRRGLRTALCSPAGHRVGGVRRVEHVADDGVLLGTGEQPRRRLCRARQRLGAAARTRTPANVRTTGSAMVARPRPMRASMPVPQRSRPPAGRRSARGSGPARHPRLPGPPPPRPGRSSCLCQDRREPAMVPRGD